MKETWTVDLIWWITVVELPALAGLFWMIWRNRQDLDQSFDACRQRCDADVAAQKERLSAYKLEVAQHYASISYLKEVEKRLTEHLVRIEDKLDRSPRDHKGAWS
ncbi:MAG: hypothetical protein H7841_09510 [Magnetospirillum sp. WYHS-4]